MNWMTADEALALLRSGMRVFVSSGCAAPQTLVEALGRRGPAVHDVEIVHILTFADAPYAGRELLGHFRHNALFIGPNVRQAVNEGLADYTPVFLSEIPALFRRRTLPLDVALIQTSAPDRHGFCSLGISVDVVKSAVDSARVVIAEVNENMPRTLGDSFVHTSRFAAMVRSGRPLLERAMEPPSPQALEIGAFVASLVPDGATIQTGIGEIPSAVLASLMGKKDLGMHTEMLTEGVRPLVEAGVLNCRRKTLLPGKVVTSFCFGNRAFYDYIHDNPAFEFRPTEFTNDPFQIARNRNMVAISSAIEVDLTGQICADSMGDRFYSGFGGQVDFIRGAARSDGGRPVIALLSTAKGGKVSRIVPRLQPGAGVVTTRADVHYVVTEYGVASLHGKSLRERALALIHIAHPKFRDELLEAARERHLVDPRQIPLPPGLQPYPRRYERTVQLKGGLEAEARPIRPTDEALLKDLFYSHSQETIFQRYFTDLKSLPHEQLQRMVTLDYRDAMAIVVLARDGERERLLGVGRYFRDPATNDAEVAITVRDEFHGHGIGTFLIRYLIEIAADNGVQGFTARVLVENRRMIRLFEKAGRKVQSRFEQGVQLLRFDLEDSQAEEGTSQTRLEV